MLGCRTQVQVKKTVSLLALSPLRPVPTPRPYPNLPMCDMRWYPGAERLPTCTRREHPSLLFSMPARICAALPSPRGRNTPRASTHERNNATWGIHEAKHSRCRKQPACHAQQQAHTIMRAAERDEKKTEHIHPRGKEAKSRAKRERDQKTKHT